MRCHVIVLDTTGTTYTFYDIDKNRMRKEITSEKGVPGMYINTAGGILPAAVVAVDVVLIV